MRFSRRLAKTPDSLEWPIKNAVILRLRIPKPWGSHQPNPSLRDLFFWGRGNLLRLIFYFFIFHVFSHKNLKKCRHPEPSLFEGVRISSNTTPVILSPRFSRAWGSHLFSLSLISLNHSLFQKFKNQDLTPDFLRLSSPPHPLSPSPPQRFSLILPLSLFNFPPQFPQGSVPVGSNATPGEIEFSGCISFRNLIVEKTEDNFLFSLGEDLQRKTDI